MQKIISFTVPGNPIPKGRPRLSTSGGFARAYTPKKTVTYESLIALAAKEQMQNKPFDGPINTTIIAHMEIPKSWPKKKQAQAENGELDHTIRSDIDNLVKSALDGMNAIVFVDDCQVVSLTARKTYSRNPRLEIVVSLL